MSSYDGFGSWNAVGNPQGFNRPGNIDSFPWNWPANNTTTTMNPQFNKNFGMYDGSSAENRLPFHTNSEVSYGFGLNSGYNRCLPHPSASRNASWDNGSRQSSMVIGHGAHVQENHWSQNRFAEMVNSGATNSFTGPHSKRNRRRKRKAFTMCSDLPDAKLPNVAEKVVPMTNVQLMEGAKEVEHVEEPRSTLSRRSKKKLKRRKNALTVNSDVPNATLAIGAQKAELVTNDQLMEGTKEAGSSGEPTNTLTGQFKTRIGEALVNSDAILPKELEKAEPATNHQSSEVAKEVGISAPPPEVLTGQVKKRNRKRKRKALVGSFDQPNATQPKEAERGGHETYNSTYDYRQNCRCLCGSTEKRFQSAHVAHASNVATNAGPFRDAPNRPFIPPERCSHSYVNYGNLEQGGLYGYVRECPPFPQQCGTKGPFLDLTTHPDLRALTAGSCFGGGFTMRSHQRIRKRKQSAQKASLKDEEMSFEKTTNCIEDPEAKPEGSETDGETEMAEKRNKIDVETKDTDEKTVEAETGTEEKVVPDKNQPRPQFRCIRDQITQILYVCSLCKFRTFCDENMTRHLQSDFHKELLHYLRSQFPDRTADFLEAYIAEKRRKTGEYRQVLTDLDRTIQKICSYRDFTKDLGMEHFVKKVDSAHCAACDILIPMRSALIHQHLKTALHIQNCKNKIEKSKKCALAVAHSILKNKTVGKSLDRFVMGENPFIEDDYNNIGADITTETVTECLVEDATIKPSVTKLLTDCSLETDLITAEDDIIPLEVPQTTMEQEGIIAAPVTTLSQGNKFDASKSTTEEKENTETPLSEGTKDLKSSSEEGGVLGAYVITHKPRDVFEASNSTVVNDEGIETTLSEGSADLESTLEEEGVMDDSAITLTQKDKFEVSGSTAVKESLTNLSKGP